MEKAQHRLDFFDSLTAPPKGGAVFLVDDIGLDGRFAPLGGKSYRCHQFLNWWLQYATGILHLDGFVSYIGQKRKSPPYGGDFSFLVDDIGLEPMTFRTSSGCSSQLS